MVWKEIFEARQMNSQSVKLLKLMLTVFIVFFIYITIKCPVRSRTSELIRQKSGRMDVAGLVTMDKDPLETDSHLQTELKVLELELPQESPDLKEECQEFVDS